MLMFERRTCLKIRNILAGWFLCTLAVGWAHAQDAGSILEATGIKGGLIVHLGCGDGQLTAALRAGNQYVVQGLDQNSANVDKARAHVQGLGLYGVVSIDRWSGKTLPYIDNLVNLLVIEDPGTLPAEEIMRVLAPKGVAYAKKGAAWTKTVKPWPDTIDEWTHFNHSAGNNAVAQDTVVGPPKHIQWVGAPKWGRKHAVPYISSLVSASGRLIAIVDEGSSLQGSIRSRSSRNKNKKGGYEPKWSLIARDGFNGILLWKQPLKASWMKLGSGFKSGNLSAFVQRRLVAVKDKVYFTFGIHAPVSELDAGTGKIIRTFDGTERTDELVVSAGKLITLGNINSKGPGKQIRPKTHWTVARNLIVIDIATGKTDWVKPIVNPVQSALAIGDGKVFVQDKNELVCFSISNGEERWRSTKVPDVRAPKNNKTFPLPITLIAWKDLVFYANGKTLATFSAKNGEALWTTPAAEGFAKVRADVLIAGGLLYVGNSIMRRGPDFTQGLDPYTGKPSKTLNSKLAFAHGDQGHHRCYNNRATDSYLTVGHSGTNFIDLKTGESQRNDWVRATCGIGVLPCNGLLYAPPHACSCYIEAMLSGFWALAPQRKEDAIKPASIDPLQKGSAYGAIKTLAANPNNEEWPTYRHDSARSGTTPSKVNSNLKQKWVTEIGGPLSTVVVAGEKVFVASIQDHSVHALNALSGKKLWSFKTGARVDSPPAILGALAIFGSRDGFVYCLRVSDGALVWRFRAAPQDRHTVSFGQLESVWPLHGNVMVLDGAVYCVAGRSSFIDGGLYLYRLDPLTGKELSKTCIYAPDPKTGKEPTPFNVRKKSKRHKTLASPDILSYDGEHIFMRHSMFDKKGTLLDARKPHLMATAGFLDGRKHHRAYWAFTDDFTSGGASAWADTGRRAPAGRLLVCNETSIYGYGRGTFIDSAYSRSFLFACAKKADISVKGKGSKNGTVDGRAFHWQEKLPFSVRALVLADKTLFAAGPLGSIFLSPDAADGKNGSVLWAVSVSDGKKTGQLPLEAQPVFDGMAAAYGKLFISLKNGSVVCLE